MYEWTVQWFDFDGTAAAWSARARFGTGLESWGANWLGCDEGSGFNQVRAEFDLSLSPGATVTQARLYVTGMG